jgi:hypothetical protein
VGVWGTDLFSDDVACDVRDHYRQLLEDGVEDDAAIRRTVEALRRISRNPAASRCSRLLSRSQSSAALTP